MDNEYKYLAIKNWGKYQARNTTDWIKDYVHKECDSDYVALTCIQRYILDGCCRIRGAERKNLPNDPMWIARRLQVDRKERRYCTHAVRMLVTRGFLILTNQQLDFADKTRLDKTSKLVSAVEQELGSFLVEEVAKPPVSAKTKPSSAPLPVSTKLGTNIRIALPVSAQVKSEPPSVFEKKPSSDPAVDDLCDSLASAIGEEPSHLWFEDAQRILSRFKVDEVKDIIRRVLVEGRNREFWLDRTHGMKNLYDHLTSESHKGLLSQYKAQVKASKVQARSTGTEPGTGPATGQRSSQKVPADVLKFRNSAMNSPEHAVNIEERQRLLMMDDDLAEEL